MASAFSYDKEFRRKLIMNDFTDEKIIIPMNKFADKHPYMPLAISIIGLLVSIIAPLLR